MSFYACYKIGNCLQFNDIFPLISMDQALTMQGMGIIISSHYPEQ